MILNKIIFVRVTNRLLKLRRFFGLRTGRRSCVRCVVHSYRQLEKIHTKVQREIAPIIGEKKTHVLNHTVDIVKTCRNLKCNRILLRVSVKIILINIMFRMKTVRVPLLRNVTTCNGLSDCQLGG